MDLTLASEIWSELKRYISTVDRGDAAETIINILIDNDADASDIRDSFKGDQDIKRALAQYLKDTDEEENEDEEDEDSYY